RAGMPDCRATSAARRATDAFASGRREPCAKTMTVVAGSPIECRCIGSYPDGARFSSEPQRALLAARVCRGRRTHVVDDAAHPLDLIVLPCNIRSQQITNRDDPDQGARAYHGEVAALGLLHDAKTLFHRAVGIHYDGVLRHHLPDECVRR